MSSHKSSVTKFQSQNFSHKISVIKFKSQNLSHTIPVTKFQSQSAVKKISLKISVTNFIHKISLTQSLLFDTLEVTFHKGVLPTDRPTNRQTDRQTGF